MASYNPKPELSFSEIEAIMQQEESEVEWPSPWGEEEFVEFARQEPLPPNQSFQLAEEEPNQEDNQPCLF